MAIWKSPCRRNRMRRFIYGLRPGARTSGLRPARARPGRLRGQPLATLASAVLHDTHAAPGAHPAQESVHAAAIALLGLEGSLDGGPLEESRTGENRGSVPEPGRGELDSAHVTSSAYLQALRCPQGFATLPAWKQPA